MVQMNGPDAIATQPFPGGVIGELAIAIPAYAARECSHPDVPRAIFHDRGNPIVGQTVRFPESFNGMAGKLVEPTFVRAHPHIAQVVLKHAVDVIVRRTFVGKVWSYFVILHMPQAGTGTDPKAAVGILKDGPGGTLQPHFVTVVSQGAFFETV